MPDALKLSGHVVPIGPTGYGRDQVRSGLAMAAGGLGAVFLANRDLLIRFVRARGAGEDAEDVVQELWLKVDRLEAVGPIGDPRAYLFRMADNLMHDRVRAAMRRSARDKAWLVDGVPGEDEIPSAERILVSRERLTRVERALATLGERTRSIFHRFRIDGVAQTRIAEEEGISLSAVEKHLQRAYRILATIAAEAEDPAKPERPASGGGGR